MKNYLIIFVFVFLIFGCKSYVQVISTKSTNTETENGFFIYENDSIKITYSFWQKKGLVTFGIYNKLNQPIYVDWKKSSYIDNSIKLNYWIEEERSNSLNVYGNYYYSGPSLIPGNHYSTIGVNNSVKIKIERITFIPPKSNYYCSHFYIMPNAFINLNRSSSTYNEKNKSFEVYYTKDNTPLLFRNFITFSLSEDFKSEFYIDNEFYVSEVLEMNKDDFQYYKRDESRKGRYYISDEKGVPIVFSDYKKENAFYVYVPKGKSIFNRKN